MTKVCCVDPMGCWVEDFDMIDNLMLQGGIERRGGAISTGPEGDEASIGDLTAFAEILKFAAAGCFRLVMPRRCPILGGRTE